jgi:aminopeptidase
MSKVKVHEKLASLIVEKCLRINENDNVTIFLYPRHIPLAEDIARECFRKGADVLLNLYTDNYYLSYMNELSVESLRQPSIFCKVLSEYSTAQVWLEGVEDPRIFKKIPAEKSDAAGEGENKAHAPYYKKVRSIGLGLALVTPKRAKTYGFDYAKWKRMMEAASTIDYEQLAAAGRRLKEVLSNASTIRITAPRGTDLTLDVSTRPWRVADGVIDENDMNEGNAMDQIPAGSIYTTPTNADGTIIFNVRTPYSGISVGKVEWKFKEGKVVEFRGDSSAKKVRDLWEKSSGDKDKIGYFGVGFNPKVRTGYTVNEIASGSISIGIGGNEMLGGINKSGFYFQHTVTGATATSERRAFLKNGRLV